jgi:peptide/nickel transport system substrate-binding protein
MVCVALAALALALAAGTAHADGKRSTAGKTLVIDTTFQLKSADPARSGEPTGEMIDKPIYETLLTFKGSNVSHPLPLLAKSYSVSKDARTYTFKLDPKARFNDGAKVTSADVVFSLRRVVNIKAIASAFLAGVTRISAKGPSTVIIKTATPNPALPYILPNSALGIVEAKVVRAHGGTDAANASTADKAESYLNTHSAGSGPYVLKSFDIASQVVLSRSPRYWRAKKAYFPTVVVRNQTAPTQILNVQRGVDEIALDLSPTQASTVRGNSVVVQRTASANFVYMFANLSPSISSVTSNPHFQAAVRYGVDYAGLARLAGTGAIQAAGIIPSMFLGALPPNAGVKHDVAKAKAEVAKSGINNPTATLTFASDVTLNGLSLATLAQKIQSDLAQVGIKLNLDGAPEAGLLDAFRAGKEEMGLWPWSPDFPDPNDYALFLPGQVVGMRATWKAGSSPQIESLMKTATTSSNPAVRTKAYQQIQRLMNASGPFFPLLQPGQVTVYTKGLTNVAYNPVWFVDIAAIGHS